MKMEQCVPKSPHIKFRRQNINQTKEHNKIIVVVINIYNDRINIFVILG